VDYIFERIQARQLPEMERKKRLLETFGSRISGLRVRGAGLTVNPPLLWIRDRGNAYILRRKIDGIHWEEAVEQLQTSRDLKSLNKSLNLNRIIIDSVGEVIDTVSEREGIKRETMRDMFAYFVSWDLGKNSPRVLIDFTTTSLEKVWIA